MYLLGNMAILGIYVRVPVGKQTKHTKSGHVDTELNSLNKKTLNQLRWGPKKPAKHITTKNIAKFPSFRKRRSLWNQSLIFDEGLLNSSGWWWAVKTSGKQNSWNLGGAFKI